ncbi:globin domain-containing protein [Clostridium sp.]|uniref:globin domain-containing protein n=1 Tax=Clostridium sp. TaxID=1506 RepID=UPI003F3BB2A9
MLNEKTIEIIKSTVPALETHGVAITTKFYELMFANNPEVKPMFDMARQESGKQPFALAQVVLAAAKNIDNLEVLLPTVQKIGSRHCEVKVTPEQYQIVGKNLLLAIKEVLGDAATDEIISAWGEAYGVIAEIFINVEKGIYSKATK